MGKDRTDKQRGWLSWLIILSIWAIGAGTQYFLWGYYEEDMTNQIMSVYIVVPTVLFCTLVWWTFFSGFRIVTRLALWGLLFLIGAGAVGMFRLDGFTGGFIPILSFRWTPTAEEKYLAAREAEEKYEGDLEALENPDQPLQIQPGDWPQFRGPHGTGVIENVPFRTVWPTFPPEPVWKKRIGSAWSSFIAVDGLLFTQMQVGPDECVTCLDMKTGKEVWLHKDEGVRFEEKRAGIGPMATPLFYRGRLYTLGGTGVLNCLDPKTGEEFWSTDILRDAETENLVWGMAGSPVGHGDLILVNPGSDDEQQTAVAAYDWKSGQKVWSGGHHQAAYSTPVVAELDGVPQVLMFDGLGLAGHSLEDGAPLWHFEWTNSFQINTAKPLLRDDGSVFISTSYGTGSALLKVNKNDSGEWSAEPTDWEKSTRFKLKFGDAVPKDGKLYGLSETILMSFDLETGKVLWKERGDFGFGQLIRVNDVLVILTDTGEVVLVEASDDHEELLRFQAIEGKSWSHPTYAQGYLFVRNAQEMACFNFCPVTSSESPTDGEAQPVD